jgi:hypothetical protein
MSAVAVVAAEAARAPRATAAAVELLAPSGASVVAQATAVAAAARAQFWETVDAAVMAARHRPRGSLRGTAAAAAEAEGVEASVLVSA